MKRSQQDLAKYLEVRRDWSDKPPCPDTAARSVQSATNATKNPMMERWQQETMREQPYNDIAAVKMTERGTTDGETTADHHKASKAQHLSPISGRNENGSG